MSDRWSSALLRCRFGGVELDVLDVGGVDGRVLSRHEYPRRDGVDLTDEGRVAQVTRARIIFTGDDHLERFAAFLGAVNKPSAQTFVHPLYGSYQAYVTGLSHSASHAERDTINVECSFEEDTTTPAVFTAGAGSPTAAGAAEVDDAGADVVAAFEVAQGAQLGDATLIADASSAAAAWEEDAATSIRDVNLELQELSGRIDAEVQRLDVANNLRLFTIGASLSRLAYSLRRAREAFAARTPRLIQVTVATRVPLLVLAAQLYGARQAQDRAAQLAALNEISNPLLLEAGTVLKAQSPAAPLTRLRSPR